jgi:hypothetical protein
MSGKSNVFLNLRLTLHPAPFQVVLGSYLRELMIFKYPPFNNNPKLFQIYYDRIIYRMDSTSLASF